MSLIISPLSIQNSIPERAISLLSETELRTVSSRENEWKRLYSSAPRPQAPTVHQLSFRSCASGKPDVFSRQNKGHCVQQTWFGRASCQSQRESQMAVIIQGENNWSLLDCWLTELFRLSSWRWKMETIYSICSRKASGCEASISLISENSKTKKWKWKSPLVPCSFAGHAKFPKGHTFYASLLHWVH